MAKKYNALIIGAGNIGAFFDTPSSDKILTHANAFSKSEGFDLLGFVDVDKKRCEEAAERWNVKAFSSIEEAFKNKVDVVCVCVPDEHHYEILKKLIDFPVKFVFAEKPLTKKLIEADEIIELYNKKNVPCMVNYSRRFMPEFEKIKDEISSGSYGNFVCGSGYYGKGTLHNGSHLINLITYFLGNITETQVLSYNFDFYRDDASVSAILRFNNGKIFSMLNIPCDNYTIFEIDLFFEKSRIRIIDSGFKLEIYNVVDSKTFKGYRNLNRNELVGNTSLEMSLKNAATNIYNHLEYEENLKSTFKDAYETMLICDKLKVSK